MIARPFYHSLENNDRHRLTRSILAGVAGLLLVITSILIWALYQDYQQTLQRAGERLQTQLRAYGSAVDIALMSADYALRDANQEVRRSGALLNDPAWLRSAAVALAAGGAGAGQYGALPAGWQYSCQCWSGRLFEIGRARLGA